MNALNVEVSYFKKCKPSRDDPPQTVNLLTFLRSEKHRAAVEQVRAIEDKEERDDLKKALLPGITPSGIFTYRDEEHLVKHSGLIAGDIDFKDNPYNPETIKRQVAKIRNVSYCGLSASGRGLWFLVPIAYPEQHKEHYAALIAYFARLGIVLDSGPANVASFRFYSFDPAAYFNLNAVPYTRLLTQQPDAYKPGSSSAQVVGNDAEKVEAIVRQIEAGRLDITGNYQDWFSLLSSLATLGEAGRDFAHRISQFYPKYRTRETDRQFGYCLQMKANRFSLGTLFKVAADHGITFKERFALEVRQPRPAPPRTPNTTTPAPMPSPRAEPPTIPDSAPDAGTGQTHAGMAMTPEGYPAFWDDPYAPPEATATNARDNAAALCEAQGWVKVGGWQPMVDTAADDSKGRAPWLDVPDLIRFFADHTPTAPVRLDAATLIAVPAAFIGAHLETVQAHNGQRGYLPYLERLQSLRRRIEGQ